MNITDNTPLSREVLKRLGFTLEREKDYDNDLDGLWYNKFYLHEDFSEDNIFNFALHLDGEGRFEGGVGIDTVGRLKQLYKVLFNKELELIPEPPMEGAFEYDGTEAYVCEVTEYERGWGQRTYGQLVALSEDNLKKACEEFNSGNTSDVVPDWYAQASFTSKHKLLLTKEQVKFMNDALKAGVTHVWKNKLPHPEKAKALR